MRKTLRAKQNRNGSQKVFRGDKKIDSFQKTKEYYKTQWFLIAKLVVKTLQQHIF